MLDHLDNPESGSELPELPRVELLKIAQSLQVSDADVMTRAELRAAIDQARRPEPAPRTQPVTWVSVARRLLASIVEQGLHLPDAAALIRGDTTLSAPPKAPPPVATVTLARIYAAQGHVRRAIATLEEVLATDPDHDMARELREQLQLRLDEERAASSAPAREAGSDGAEARSADHAEAAAPSRGAAHTASNAHANGAAAEARSADHAEAAAPSRGAAHTASDAHAGSADAEAQGSAPTAPADAPRAPAATALGAPGTSSSAPPSEAVPASSRRAEDLPTAPSPAQLLLIETGDRETYVYWELARPRELPREPHWISVVAHTPAFGGCERHERRFPVQHEAGALRLEGVPRSAVVRAKLSSSAVEGAPPLAVATCMRTASARGVELWAGGASPGVTSSGASFEPRFTPHARASSAALARCANGALAAHLEKASAAYW